MQPIAAPGQFNSVRVVQLRLHRRCRLIALGGLAFHGVEDDLLDLRRDLRIPFPRSRRVAANAGVHDYEHILVFPFERGHADHHFVKHRSETVDVGPHVPALPLYLLGGHVIGCPH